MKQPLLKVVKNEFREEKRVLKRQEPKPLNPPQFEVDLVDMSNPGIKWHYGIIKYWG